MSDDESTPSRLRKRKHSGDKESLVDIPDLELEAAGGPDGIRERKRFMKEDITKTYLPSYEIQQDCKKKKSESPWKSAFRNKPSGTQLLLKMGYTDKTKFCVNCHAIKPQISVGSKKFRLCPCCLLTVVVFR